MTALQHPVCITCGITFPIDPEAAYCPHGKDVCPECLPNGCGECEGDVEASGDVVEAKIATPGLVYGMSDETYHADPITGGSLSSTFARLLTEHVPAKALEIRNNRKPTKAMNLGKAAHAHALGAGPELVVWEHDGRTKEGKAERAAWSFLIESEAAVAVTEAERAQIEGMVTALRADPAVVKILEDSQSEVSGFWTEGGVWCRARYDLLTEDAAYDYKTCQDASRRGFSRTMASYGYHQQADFYQRGLKALAHPAANRPMRFICQEVTAPYLAQIHTPDDEALSVADALNDRAIRVYAECSKTDAWPGYDVLEPDPTPLPAYYFFDHEDVLPDTWKPSTDLSDVELKLA